MKYGIAAIAVSGLLGCAVLLGPARVGAAATGADAPEPVVSVWQHHKTSFSYSGFTSAYTCDGLADRVRQMFRLLGARKDMTIFAGSCPGGPSAPSHMILVNVDFYTLTPASAQGAAPGDAAAAGDAASTVNAQWTPIKFVPHSPDYMGDGDCELMQSMKDFIGKYFTLRDLEYRTDCFPHTISMNSYAVKGQALKVPAAAGAAKN